MNKHKENDKWTRVVHIDSLYNEVLTLCSCKLSQLQVIARKTGEGGKKSRSLQYLSGLEVNGLIHFLLRGRHQNKRCHTRKHVWKLSDCNSPLPRGSINEWWREIDSQVCRRWVTDTGKASCHRRLWPFTGFSYCYCPLPFSTNQQRSHLIHTTLKQSAVNVIVALLQGKGAFSVSMLSVHRTSYGLHVPLHSSFFQMLGNEKSNTEKPTSAMHGILTPRVVSATKWTLIVKDDGV